MLSKLRTLLVCTVVLFAAPALLPAQTTINVGPGQTYTTIQSGINAANPGDTVLVAPGTYNENINFNGKAITVTSSGGAAVTTINGGNKDGLATVTFDNAENSTSVISNFTITGGGNTIFGAEGNGGVFVNGVLASSYGASPTIQGNTITANYCHNIDVEFGTARILNNVVSNVLQNNQSTNYCTFRSAIFLGGTPNFLTGLGSSVVGNTIENNLKGSGINLWAAQNALIMNNTIRNNTSPDPGSAFTSANSGGTVLVQNLIYRNTSICGGALGFEDGGFVNGNPDILIANNTIVDNVTPNPSGGSECTKIAQLYPGPYSYGSDGPGSVIINNIISGSTSYPAVNCSWYDIPSLSIQPVFEHNILYNAAGPFFGSFCIDVSGQDNNLAVDPQFVNPAANDYHLQSTSPAIDAGNNTVLQTFLTMTGFAFTKDYDSNPRLQDATHKGHPIIDMGAYEYSGTLDGNSVTETLTSSLNPSTYGDNVTFNAVLTSNSGTPTGTVQFKDGTAVLGVQTISATGTSSFSTSTLAIGTHPITAVYEPTGLFTATTASLSQVVNSPGTPAITLTSSLNPAPALTPITFTAQVAAGSGGTIVFALNGQSITTTPNAAGTSTTTISTLTPGSYPVTATWFATNSALSAQASLTQIITAAAAAPDFSFTGPDITFSVDRPATGTLALTSLNGFTGSVSLTCNPPYPPNYTCTLQQPSIALTSGLSASVTYTLTPTYLASTRSTRIVLASLFPLTLLSLLGLTRKRRTPLRTLLTLTLLAILASATTACGPDHFITIATGTFPLTFTATGTNQGSPTPTIHTLLIKVIITP